MLRPANAKRVADNGRPPPPQHASRTGPPEEGVTTEIGRPALEGRASLFSLTVPVLLIASASAMPVQEFLPCARGLRIEYHWQPIDGGKTAPDVVNTRVDHIEGQKGRLCFIRRTTFDDGKKADSDVYVVEHLTDRVLDAGWRGALTAFRAPLLRAPLSDGQRWRFNRVNYRVERLSRGFKTPAGRFDSAVRIHASSIPKGEYHAIRTYVRGVGLVEDRREQGAWIAVKIHRPKSSAPAK